MKRLIFCLVCILLCSCDPIWVFHPPYCNYWWVENDSSQELVVLVGVSSVKQSGDVYSFEDEYALSKGDSCYVYNNIGKIGEDLSKETLFALMTANVDYIKFANADKSIIFREFDINSSNVQHNPYEESSWEYKEFTEQVSEDYYQLFKMWYYTITDEDLVVAE